MRAVVSEGNELFFEDAFDTTSGAAEAIKIDLQSKLLETSYLIGNEKLVTEKSQNTKLRLILEKRFQSV